MLPLSPCSPHTADSTQNLPRGHTQEAAPSPCPAVLPSSFSWALKKPRRLWGLERTLLEWHQRGQHGLRHQDGVTFLFSPRNTSIPPPDYPIFPALLHLFPRESSSSLHSIRHSHQPLLRAWTQRQCLSCSPSHAAPFTPSLLQNPLATSPNSNVLMPGRAPAPEQTRALVPLGFHHSGQNRNWHFPRLSASGGWEFFWRAAW